MWQCALTWCGALDGDCSPRCSSRLRQPIIDGGRQFQHASPRSTVQYVQTLPASAIYRATEPAAQWATCYPDPLTQQHSSGLFHHAEGFYAACIRHTTQSCFSASYCPARLTIGNRRPPSDEVWLLLERLLQYKCIMLITIAMEAQV